MMDQLSLVPYEGAGGGGGGDGKYKECMRNHAAAMGGQAFDGCGEYMPSSPDSLKCAACGCHRSFHRRAAGSSSCGAAAPVFFRPPPLHHQHHHHHQAALQAFLPSVPAAAAPHLALPYHAVPNAAAAAPWLARSGSETPPRADDFGVAGLGLGGSAGGAATGSGSFGRKRFRTKFTPEQKERMREFAEKQGWRIQRNDDGALERFCDEIGVKRQVLKVWMHNHKNQLASTSPTSAAAAAAGIGISPAGPGMRTGAGASGDGDDDDDDTDDSPPRAAVSSPSPSPISV
ncbi:zinc-finger homeodomain protein 8-like [Panicum miliaceum]|uniref:Zinc-finger homeodomain protein 8-like n=1 Tax=Panicum miliaceum TaxID=4540 RepID=A0A3L6PUK9_PANMI|nr:zinc-finger homeodomain protein 8-like [Panicum miliaceum]